MILHHRLLTPPSPVHHTPIVLLHGLFGSMDNLSLLAKKLATNYPTLQLDIRNHGLSPRTEIFSYAGLAQDVIDTLDNLNYQNFALIGHSIGGKIAMAITSLAPQRVKKLVVIDIAPVSYPQPRHDAIFAALNAVRTASISSRSEAASIMGTWISNEDVIQFLLKSFHHGDWRFDVAALEKNYSQISGWRELQPWHGPAMFIRGEKSDYLDEQYKNPLVSQFPEAKAWLVAGADHWVHAEKPETVLRIITRFFATSPALE
ncbi:MAG: Esterase YbfF [Candidatus Erwinia impunctatus]|nr:Esterase YbfF [Culicoides impunctatus]